MKRVDYESEGLGRQAKKEELDSRYEHVVVLASLGKTFDEVAKDIGQTNSYTNKLVNQMIDRGVPIEKKGRRDRSIILGLTVDLEDAIAAVRTMRGLNELPPPKELTPGQAKKTSKASSQYFPPWWGILTRRETINI